VYHIEKDFKMRTQEYIDARNAAYNEYEEANQAAFQKHLDGTRVARDTFRKAEEEFRKATIGPDKEYDDAMDKNRLEYKKKLQSLEKIDVVWNENYGSSSIVPTGYEKDQVDVD
jgi:hypothetical protein